MGTQEPADISFWGRERSFSITYLTGAVRQHVPALLVSYGYSIIGEAYFTGAFLDTLDVVDARETNRNIVRVADYQTRAGTVLLESTAATMFGAREEMVAFCAEHGVEAIFACWERYSQTVIAMRVTKDGLRSETILVAGVLQKVPLDPPAELMAHPGPDALRTFLSQGGADIEQVFGRVSARVYRLDRRVGRDTDPGPPAR